ADEPQPGAGVGAREHRADHPRGRDCFALHRVEVDAWHRHQVDRPPDPLAVRLVDLARHRPHDGAPGYRAARYLRDVPLHDDHPVNAESAAAMPHEINLITTIA